MTVQEILGDNLGQEFVTVYVGKEKKEYSVHKKVICDAADYFSKAFTGAFKERDGVIHLPEESPAAFGLFVDWLYKGSVPYIESQQHLERLFKLYVFAEKLCMNELANEIMDKIRALCSHESAKISPPMVAYVFKHTFGDSPLRKWSLHDLVYRIDSKTRTGVPGNTMSAAIRELCIGSEDFFEAYLSHIRAYTKKGLPDPRKDPSPHSFHRLRAGWCCPPSTSVPQQTWEDSLEAFCDETQSAGHCFD